VCVWSMHCRGGRTYEAICPGFAAWRQQHKGVPTASTLGASKAAGRRPRKRRRGARDGQQPSAGGVVDHDVGGAGVVSSTKQRCDQQPEDYEHRGFTAWTWEC
jgi:hypothetical protein